MSFPRIPGFTAAGDDSFNLSHAWDRPEEVFPETLWPYQRLSEIELNPSGWVTLEEHFFTQQEHGGRGCVLIDAGEHVNALRDTSWLGRDLGEFCVWSSPDGDDGFNDGLASDQEQVRTEFFVHARKAIGTSLPQIEIALPFLWFWDAFEVAEGWRYVSAAGREHELIRFERSEDAWKVDVRVEELRTFLKACGKSALIQVDYVLKGTESGFDRIDSEFHSDWAHVDFHAVADFLTGTDNPSMSRICGQYIFRGHTTARRPRWEEFHSATDYPEFVYGIDPQTGAYLTHSCKPDELGTYFDQDDSRLHYLTPIYFRRAVLQDYVAEPARYEVTPFRLSCFNLWGVDISLNSVGLVEVYLGDIGKRLPYEEWGHWRSYNVPPEGQMEEGRFRRDFLNQWASSPDPIGDMRRAREKVNEAARAHLGTELWRPLPKDLELQYRSLMGPLTEDPSALVAPLLIVAKVFVDGLDSKILKKAVGGSVKDEKSLALLGRLLKAQGDEDDSAKVLRDLYAIRSRGGIAHLQNTGSNLVLAELGIDGLPPTAAFEKVVQQVGVAVARIGELLGGRAGVGGSEGGASA